MTPKDPLVKCIEHYKPKADSTEYMIRVSNPTPSSIRRCAKSGLSYPSIMALSLQRLMKLRKWLKEQGCVALTDTLFQGSATKDQVFQALEALKK